MRKKNQRVRVGWSLIVVLALLLSLVAGSVPTEKLSAASSDAASVFLDPPSQPAGVGDRVTVDIKINHVSNLYGAEVHLAFDPALLKVVDADLIMDGDQIAPSTDFFAFTPDQYHEVPGNGKRYYHTYSEATGGYFIARAEANNAAGTISYAFTLLDPAPAVSVGPAAKVLATITFERLAEGEAHIEFANPLVDELPVKLADVGGLPITILPRNITGAVITGEILLPRYTLSMAVTGNGSTDPAVGDHTYPAGAVVPITATPDTGYQFVNWTGDVGTVADVNAASTTITMDGDKSVTAHFTAVGNGPSLRIEPASQTVVPGGTFTVDLMVDAIGFSLRGLEATVTFDATVMSTGAGQVAGHNLLGALDIGPTIRENTVTYAMAAGTGQPDISGSMLTIEFTVNSDASLGTYDITISAAELRDENNVEITLVNLFHGTATVGRKGDFDGNGEIGLFDFVEFAGAFGSQVGDANYDPIADFDDNGEVGLYDFVEFAGIFGTTL